METVQLPLMTLSIRTRQVGYLNLVDVENVKDHL